MHKYSTTLTSKNLVDDRKFKYTVITRKISALDRDECLKVVLKEVRQIILSQEVRQIILMVSNHIKTFSKGMNY